MVAQGISEHSAKKLIAQQIQLWENRSNSPQILTDLPACQIDFDPASQRAELRHCEANLRQHSATTLVLKPDQLLKRRGKLGLVHFVQRSHDEHTDKSFVDLVEKARNLAEKESQKELTVILNIFSSFTENLISNQKSIVNLIFLNWNLMCFNEKFHIYSRLKNLSFLKYIYAWECVVMARAWNTE